MSFLRASAARARFLALAARNLGGWQTVAFVAQRAAAAVRPGRRPYPLWSKHAAWPVRVRAGSSDPVVFRQIFIEREYSCLDDLRVPPGGLVIDAGANIGASSVYFLNRFPECHVVAVEPDPDNFRMLQQNLAPYGPRAEAVRAGLWSNPGVLAVGSTGYRDDASWARQVREARADDPDAVPAVDVPGLMKAAGAERVAVLKIDIEGAEAVVFGPGCDDWLGRVDALTVELHDDTAFGPATRVVRDAVGRHPFEVSTAGELFVARRPGL